MNKIIKRIIGYSILSCAILFLAIGTAIEEGYNLSEAIIFSVGVLFFFLLVGLAMWLLITD